MPSLPVPMISALALTFLLAQAWASGRRLGWLGALIALCAGQSALIALVQHYGVSALAPVQPITASVIPPLAWVALVSSARRGLRLLDAMHLIGPGVTALALVLWPEVLALWLPAVFLGYGVAILATAIGGADGLPQLRIEAGDVPARIWRVIGLLLIASGLSDALIVAADSVGLPGLRPWIITVFSAATLLVLGTLSLSTALSTDPDDPAPPIEPDDDDPGATEADLAIIARLDALMAERALYLDPELSVTRLSRRLGLPLKQLSGAVNRATGDNVSRYINKARIAAAQQLLANGTSVTEAMFAAGFNTKSNFNREFLRVTGRTPSAWRTKAQTTGSTVNCS
jgi:AraC-like DNA-binding protein